WLCNGARGTVYDIGWAPGADPIQDSPCVIMMEFDKYNGPVFLTTPDGKKIVPILSVERDFLIGATFCARTQFPLIVCYAITVHKSQSITEDMIVTDLSCQDFQTGLSYVAVSRVETLEGLMLEAPFDRNHLVYGSPPDGMKMKMRDQELRKRQVLTQNPYMSHNTKNCHGNRSVPYHNTQVWFLETREDISETNFKPAFLFASFLGFHVLYNTFRDHQDNLGEFVSAFVDYARVHQGVRAVTANFWPQILASNLASLLGIVEIGNRVDHLEAGIETIELRKQLETLSDSSRMPVTASIDALQRMQWVLDLVNQNPQSFSNRIQAALAWPVIISDDYINALYLRHPEALAVLAFFLAFVYENRSYWVFEPCAGSLIEALANHLGPFWKEGLSWPLSKIAGS
ncbi:Uncharacterized protein HZ326_28972, partial [Fusarium oxysporum f. sp. albedinis]